jgi:phosphatidylglycerophosphate synthase
MTRSRLLWWADAVTISRVLLLPALIWAAEVARAAVVAGAPAAPERRLTLAVLLVIGASDIVDGWLARRSGVPPTKRGAILDAAADRIVQWTGVWYLALRGAPAFTPLPLWLAGTLVLRDALLLSILLRMRGAKAESFEHELHGKAATFTIFVASCVSISGAPNAVVIPAALVAAGAVTYSAVRYAARFAANASARPGELAPRGG